MGKYDHITDPSERASLELLDTLGKDPAARKAIQREAKRLNPALVFPELEAENVVLEAEKRIDEKLSARDKAEKDALVQRRIDDGRKALTEMGFQEAEIKDIEDRMIKGELANDYTKAGQVANKERELKTPSSEYDFEANVLTMPDKEKFKGFYENPGLAAQREAHKAIGEIMQSHGK